MGDLKKTDTENQKEPKLGRFNSAQLLTALALGLAVGLLAVWRIWFRIP